MDRPDDDTRLSAEEFQIIYNLAVGGLGPPGPATAYVHAVRSILGVGARRAVPESVDPHVTFRLQDIRDPRPRRGRPSAATEHRKRLARCSLYRGLAWACVEALDQANGYDRNVRRRDQRARQAAVRKLHQAGEDVLAARVAAEAERLALVERERISQRRIESKSIVDNLCLNIEKLLDRYAPRIRGERRKQKIGAVLAALNLGSSEPSAVRQRFRRIPADMKAAASRT